LQNREKLSQKGHDGSRKTMCRDRGKNVIFRRGGINFIFGQKYRPLLTHENTLKKVNVLRQHQILLVLSVNLETLSLKMDS
jgi:hypothetical protein